MISVPALLEKYPELEAYAKRRRLTNGKYKVEYDFALLESQYLLAECTVKEYFGLHWYKLPRDRLCPRIPNRLRYLEMVEQNLMPLAHICRKMRTGAKQVNSAPYGASTVVDVGTGASLIYAVIGRALNTDRMFVCSEVDPASVMAANEVIVQNKLHNVSVQHTPFFPEVTGDVLYTVCNPPFYSNRQDMEERKAQKGHKGHDLIISSSESIYEGGEVAFICNLIDKSCTTSGAYSCAWFTTQVGIQENVEKVMRYLREKGARGVWKGCLRFRTSRWIVAWNWVGMRGVKEEGGKEELQTERGKELQAKRGKELQAKRGKEELQAKRGKEELQAKRGKEELQAKRGKEELQAKRGKEREELNDERSYEKEELNDERSYEKEELKDHNVSLDKRDNEKEERHDKRGNEKVKLDERRLKEPPVGIRSKKNGQELEPQTEQCERQIQQSERQNEQSEDCASCMTTSSTFNCDSFRQLRSKLDTLGKTYEIHDKRILLAHSPFWLRKERRKKIVCDEQGWKLAISITKRPFVLYNDTGYDDTSIMNGLLGMIKNSDR